MRAFGCASLKQTLVFIALGAFLISSLWVNSAAMMINGAEGSGAAPARARLGIPFDIAYGETVDVAGSNIQVTFVNVTEDSRCPSDVTCIWAGQVSVDLGLADTSGSDLGNVVLTSGAGSNGSSAEYKVGEYVLKLVDVEPYPVSTQNITLSEYVATLILSKEGDGALLSRSVLVMAVGGNGTQAPAMTKFISAWSIERENGTAIMVLRDDEMTLTRIIARFLPFDADCTHGVGMAECIDGQITMIFGNAGVREGDFIHIEVDNESKAAYVSFKTPMTGDDGGNVTGAATEYTLEIRKFREVTKPYVPHDSNTTVVTLREGQREGPLLVQEIFPDRIEGLNFPEYPVAMEQGLPITLRVGETASNGCTVFLTLLKIEGDSATFLKKVDENRPCPICWLQLELMSGWP